MLSRDDVARHLTSEMFFSGDRLPGFCDTVEHPDGLVLVDTGRRRLVLGLAAPTHLAHVEAVRVPRPRP